MANQLTLTDTTGNVILTCEVNLDVTIDADAANATAINTALAADKYVQINIVGNSVPTTANTTLMYSTLKFQQFEPDQSQPQTGTITVTVL